MAARRGSRGARTATCGSWRPRKNKIAGITPTGTITEFPLSVGHVNPRWPGQIVFGPDGNIWFGEMNAQRIGRMTTQGVVTDFPLLTTEQGAPNFLAVGADGNIWGTDSSFSQILRITP